LGVGATVGGSKVSKRLNVQTHNTEEDVVYKRAAHVEVKFEAGWKDVEKQLERLAEERRTLIAKEPLKDSDPKAWPKALDASPSKGAAGERASTPPPPPPPNAHGEVCPSPAPMSAACSSCF
jgi:hypothetical protein